MALYVYFAGHGSATLGFLIPQLGLGRCLLEFTLGNVLCLLWLRFRDMPQAAGWAGALAVGALMTGWGLRLAEISFVPLTFAAIILFLALDKGPVARALGGRVLTYLGEISYSTYLAHFLLFILFKLAFVRSTPVIGLGQLAAFMLLVGGVSVILYHGLEKPTQRWLNGLVLRRDRQVVSAAG